MIIIAAAAEGLDFPQTVFWAERISGWTMMPWGIRIHRPGTSDCLLLNKERFLEVHGSAEKGDNMENKNYVLTKTWDNSRKIVQNIYLKTNH